VQQPAQAQVSAQQLVQVLALELQRERERVLALELLQERRLVQAHFQRHLQLQSQFLQQQCHLREHEFR
jgi:hypothetical protein